jgi:hypothetical protein
MITKPVWSKLARIRSSPISLFLAILLLTRYSKNPKDLQDTGFSYFMKRMSVWSSQVVSVSPKCRFYMRSILRRRTASAPNLEGLSGTETVHLSKDDIATEFHYAVTKFRHEQLHCCSHQASSIHQGPRCSHPFSSLPSQNHISSGYSSVRSYIPSGSFSVIF